MFATLLVAALALLAAIVLRAVLETLLGTAATSDLRPDMRTD